MSPQMEPSANETDEGSQTVVRDFGEAQIEGPSHSGPPSQPPVALVSTKTKEKIRNLVKF